MGNCLYAFLLSSTRDPLDRQLNSNIGESIQLRLIRKFNFSEGFLPSKSSERGHLQTTSQQRARLYTSTATNMEYRWLGRNIHFNSDSIQLTRVLSQHLDSNLDECVIVALGVNRANEQLTAKLRIE
jgi:hypothetical protein